jgi:hypothetical protein
MSLTSSVFLTPNGFLCFESIVVAGIFEGTSASAQGNRYRHCCIRPMRDRKCSLYRLMERFQHEQAAGEQVAQKPAAAAETKPRRCRRGFRILVDA